MNTNNALALPAMVEPTGTPDGGPPTSNAGRALPCRPGIYCILCVPTGKRYIGLTKNLRLRRRVHVCMLRQGYHRNQHLQSAWSLYGEQNFEWTVQEECPPDQLEERELFWIAHYKTADRKHGYNKSPGGERPQVSAETRALMSRMFKGRKLPAHQVAAMKLRRATPETRAKMSAAARGRKVSAETRAKMSAAHKRRWAEGKFKDRKPMNAAGRARQIAAVKAIKNDPERRQKLSEAMLRVWALRREGQMPMPKSVKSIS